MKDYIIKKGENKYSPFAGTKLISDIINKLNMEDSINKTFGLPLSNRGYKPFDYIKSIISGLISGADCIKDIDNIKEDGVVKKIWNLKNIPHSSRIGIFLSRFSSTNNINLIHNIMQDIAIKAIHKSKLKGVTLDGDATFVKTDKQGVSDYCYKGFKSLSMLLGFIAETSSCIYQELGKGSKSPALNLDKQLYSVNDKLSSNNIKLKNYRSDSAGYQANIVNYCNANSINFYIRGKNINLDFSLIKDWDILYDKYGSPIDDTEISETVHTMDRTEAFRLIVVRKQKEYSVPSLFGESFYEYHTIATNSDLSKEEVFHFYNERGKCEYYIKSVKWDLSLRKLPCGTEEANALWVNTALIAYNALKLFSVITGLNKSLKSLRYLIFNTVGRIVSHANKTYLKLFCNNKKYNLFLYLREKCLTL
ncbi:MAG: IS1380 family transposase [Candidatus Acididesulfobacter diazotrophicus]|uniref:IS1380 family transposase n=1 Tax=Candidatus Acididesulfobacter diazotrophicus TaxID=2597226 RepID=A0A519BKP1_9DELT|nr:MAG: IS1380 family transposase [Candidatus Acididesulfobacter diazotrophicus]